MAALLPARLSRLAICSTCLLLATAGLTFAAAREQTAQARSSGPPATLVVPDVRGQAYVFAKVILEDAGFAWRVQGGVHGFAVNLVATQRPSPGARVLDTGAPTISLQLNRNSKYDETGVPENFSPYAGTRVLRPGARRPPATARPHPRKRPAAQPPAARKKPSAKRPVRSQRPVRKAGRKQAVPPAKRKSVATRRPAAFHLPGLPKEPVHEMPLPKRAWLLGVWLRNHPRATYANVDHWLYQHAWVVTGAKFGWWRGAKALRILIAVDGRVISAWGIGARSREVARAALAEVRAKGQ